LADSARHAQTRAAILRADQIPKPPPMEAERSKRNSIVSWRSSTYSFTNGRSARGGLERDRARIVALDVLANLVDLDARTAEDGAVAASHLAGDEPLALGLDAPNLLEKLG